LTKVSTRCIIKKKAKELKKMSAKEKEIKKYMEKLGISYEEAEQLWEDDQEDYIGEEGEQMTKKAKGLKRYEKADTKRKKSTRERKVDNVKLYLLELAEDGLEGYVENIEYYNELSFSFDYEGEHFSLKLTRHRKEK
jgi:alpha-L-fucosidase